MLLTLVVFTVRVLFASCIDLIFAFFGKKVINDSMAAGWLSCKKRTED